MGARCSEPCHSGVSSIRAGPHNDEDEAPIKDLSDHWAVKVTATSSAKRSSFLVDENVEDAHAPQLSFTQRVSSTLMNLPTELPKMLRLASTASTQQPASELIGTESASNEVCASDEGSSRHSRTFGMGGLSEVASTEASEKEFDRQESSTTIMTGVSSVTSSTVAGTPKAKPTTYSRRGLTIENPDNIHNVFLFSKNKVSRGDSIGVIRKGTRKVTGAIRAVKFIPKSLPKEKLDTVRARMDVATTFDHPNLVSLHETFEDQDYTYLVMDYCEGSCLENWMAKHGKLTELSSAVVMHQVLRAIYYMHSHRICHRDVRPKNLLFVSSAKEIEASCPIKVSGFGTSCHIKNRRKLSKICGHDGYMAPEMLSGAYGKEVDLWSCGAVMFEMLCGCVPGYKTQYFPNQDIGISTYAMELMCLLLEADPQARYNIKQAVHHKFITRTVPRLSAMPVDASILSQLQTFRSLSRLQQAALRMVVGQLSEQETAISRKLFLFLDRDGDGYVVPDEVDYIASFDSQTKAEYPDISEIFKQSHHSDVTNELAFSYTEFVAATFSREESITEAVGRVAFRCFDKNGDGLITISELAAGHLLSDLSLEELGYIYQDMDKNMDSSIDFSEFMSYVKGPAMSIPR